MFKKILNWIVVNRVITPSNFISFILLFNLIMLLISIYLQINHQIYLTTTAAGFEILDYVSIALNSYAYPFKSFLTLSRDAAFAIEIPTYCLIHFLFFKIYRLIFTLDQAQMNNLVGLGFGEMEERNIKQADGHWKKTQILHPPYYIDSPDRILLGTYNFKLTTKEVTGMLEKLSNIFRVSFIEVGEKSYHGKQLVYTIVKDVFSEIEVKNIAPHFYTLLAGKNTKNEDIVLDLRSAFSIFIGGTSGSGKTNLINNYIKQIYNSVGADLDIRVIDDKGVNFKDLIDSYHATYYDSSSLEDLKSFNSFLIDLLELKNQSKKILANNNVEHAEDLRQRGVELPIRRTLILCDEAGAYLRFKDEPREDYKEIKKLIVNNLTITLSQLRAFGIPIIVASQRVTKDEIQVPYDNFQVRLFNGISVEMSQKYCEGLVGTQKSLGKWYINSDHYNGFIKTPFISIAPIASQFSSKNLPFVNFDGSKSINQLREDIIGMNMQKSSFSHEGKVKSNMDRFIKRKVG